MGDLTMPGTTTGREWLNKKKLNEVGLSALVPILEGLQPPVDTPHIRVGYCILPTDTVGAEILEVLGWIGPRVCVRRWSPLRNKGKCTPGTRLTLLAANRSRGAGSDDTVEPELLTTSSLRVIMGPDVPTGKKEKRHIERIVKLVVDQGALTFHSKNDIPSLWEELAGDFLNMHVPLEIYTDGAWERKRGTLEDVFMYGSDAQIEGSAGIVITAAGEHWRSMGVHCFRITDGALIASLSVFPLELIASVVAIKIAACLHCYCEVFTDC